MNKIPSVGSTVKVTVRFRNIAYGETSPFRDIVFIGKVVRSPHWAKADNFAVETGNIKFPISLIDSKYVVDLEIISGKTEKVEKYEIKSDTSKHFVTVSGNQFSCDCTGFKYRAKCKHITAVKEHLG